jgi:hypothetical protein
VSPELPESGHLAARRWQPLRISNQAVAHPKRALRGFDQTVDMVEALGVADAQARE